MLSCANDSISVAARTSALSRAQVAEVLCELQRFFPKVQFSTRWIETRGDRDLKTSLRLLDKTDFFTREIDQMLLNQECRIAIHSAKDLPDPLPKGLSLVAVTKGVSPLDVLVTRKGETLPQLCGAKVGVSSLRREEGIRQLLPHAQCVDIRGTIERRLAQLEEGLVDALVVAEAALIRLGLTDLSYIPLPCTPAPMQGRLAIIAREEDSEMRELFRCLDAGMTT
jgi:hydroxymethylbilane synthase